MTRISTRQKAMRAIEAHGLVIVMILFFTAASAVMFNMHHNMRTMAQEPSDISRSIHEMAWATLAAAILTATVHAVRLLNSRRHRTRTETGTKHNT